VDRFRCRLAHSLIFSTTSSVILEKMSRAGSSGGSGVTLRVGCFSEHMAHGVDDLAHRSER